jgi:hypothetical protein
MLATAEAKSMLRRATKICAGMLTAIVMLYGALARTNVLEFRADFSILGG